ncbi:Aminotransferase, class I/classII [Corchorus capsularis]|uniref:histidinol-phosphate transaminase n=1 Tax=Corchorus capsularis TaxID=210143 RepID=A0A1R3FUJ3_COCAP|nr:Aminotransferase, class I/classII [Corchorus capsularis]
MGVSNISNPSNAASLGLVKSKADIIDQTLKRPFCSIKGNHRRVIMASISSPSSTGHDVNLKLSGDSFIRPHLRKLSAYQPILPFEVLSAKLGIKPEDIIKLDANENPYGPPPEVLEALGSLKFPYIYPDPESRQLRAALAKDSGLESDYILVGCGCDELIDLIMRCVLDPGDKIVDCPPTFTMYEFDAGINAADVIKVPRKPDFSLNVELIAKVVELEKPKCIFLTSPNNPDGRLDCISMTGLAGLRVGYGAFPLSIIEYLWRAKQPYNVSVAAEVAACAALQNPKYLEMVKESLVQERDRLFKLLKEVPFLNPYPSYSNFILCGVTSGMDAKKLKDDLSKMGVMVRHYNNKELKGYIRVTAGKPEHTDALMECLRRVS